MTSELFGSHRLFATMNPWVLGVVLYFGVNAFVLLGRKIFEGRAYNVAYSSWLGSAALIGCMSIAGHVLHRPDLPLPAWLTSSMYHQIVAGVSIVIGICMGALAIYQTTWAKSQWVDLAFNLVIAPLFMYLLATLLPVINLYLGVNVPTIYKTMTIVLLMLYGVTAIIDIRTGRLHQPEWVAAHLDN